MPAVGQAQDERIVIVWRFVRLVIGAGCQDLDLCAAEGKGNSTQQFADWNPWKRVVCGYGTGPEFGHAEIAQNGGQTAGVIVVEMRNGDCVQVMDSARPQVGRDHIFADVQAGGGFNRFVEQRDSAGIHQDDFAIREGNQDSVALADIDCGDFKRARLGECGEGVRYQDGERGQGTTECRETNFRREADGRKQ